MSRFSKLELGEKPIKPQPDLKPHQAEEEGTTLAGYDSLLAEADLHFYRGNFRKALQMFSRALQEDNTQSAPWLGQVLCHVAMKQPRDAAVWGKRAAGQFPENPDILAIHALPLAMQGMAQRALGTLDYAMQKPEAGTFVWLVRGWVLLENDNANWRACFDKVRESLRPEDWRSHCLMGLALEHNRKWVGAAKAFAAAVEIRPDNFFLWFHLGKAQKQLGFPTKAAESWKRALELEPNFAPAKAALARAGRLSPLAFFKRLAGLFSSGKKD